MTALYVLAGILVFFTVLLLCPVTFLITYKEKAAICISYLFFKIRLPSQKPKKAKKQKAKKEKPKKSDVSKQLKELFGKDGLSGFLPLFSEFVKIVVKMKKQLSKAVVSQFDVAVSVASSDAADTAVLYGKVCAAVYPAVSVLLRILKCKNYHISVSPNFAEEKTKVAAICCIRIRLWLLLSSAIGLFVRSIKLWYQVKTDKNKEKEPSSDAQAQNG